MSAPTLWQRLFGKLSHSAPPRADRLGGHALSHGPVASTAEEELLASDARQLRGQRREQLFSVVRENMVRAGVLSSAYKFKALTLDRQGSSFILMFDIDSNATDSRPEALRALEHSLQTLVQEHIGVTVKAVYWRARENPEPANNARTKADTSLDEIARRSQAMPHPDFEPTQPMPRRDDSSEFTPLSPTQHGRLE
jgi:hypothetical protein